MTVKVRKVGNSNVVTLPKELERYGLVDGVIVSFIPLRSGQVLIVPAEQMEDYLDQLGGQIVERRREALQKLAAHDRGEE